MAVIDLHDIHCSSSDTNTNGQRGSSLNLQILGECQRFNFFPAIIMFVYPLDISQYFYFPLVEILDLGHDFVS